MRRNGTHCMCGVSVGRILLPYGMREIDGYGKNVWEFFNRSGDVIGLPFRLARRHSDEKLMAVSWEGENCHLTWDHEFGRIVYFSYGSPFEIAPRELQNIMKVMSWKLSRADGELRGLPAVEYPHTFCKWKVLNRR